MLECFGSVTVCVCSHRLTLSQPGPPLGRTSSSRSVIATGTAASASIIDTGRNIIANALSLLFPSLAISISAIVIGRPSLSGVVIASSISLPSSSDSEAVQCRIVNYPVLSWSSLDNVNATMNDTFLLALLAVIVRALWLLTRRKSVSGHWPV